MSNKHQKLLEKYYNATTSLKEEQLLMDQSNELDTTDLQWLNVCQQQQSIAPKTLQNDIWNKIQAEETSARKINFRRWTSVAAAVLVVISIATVHISNQRQLRRIQKMAMLEEAFFTLSSDIQVAQTPTILYEDELITCYDN